ncbi:MAG: sulfatase-like hydrolase/transferase [Chitinophagales bacterium]
MKRYLTPWIASFCILHLFDWLIQSTRNPTSIVQPNVYVLSIFMSILFFYAIGLIYNALSIKSQKVFAFIFSFFLTVLIVSHYFVYHEFGDSFGYSMLNFAVDNPHYLLSFTKTYFLNARFPLLLVLYAFILWIWYPNAEYRPQPKPLPKLLLIVLCIGVLHFTIIKTLSFDVLGRKLTPDIALLFSGYNYIRDNIDKKHKLWLHASPDRFRPEKPVTSDTKKYNIILIINESWGKKGVWLYNGQHECMPNLKKWIEDEPSNFVVFKHAFSNASATAMSVPSLMTGSAPWETSMKFHSMPFLWDWAKGAGYRTILVSSQYYKWANLENFFFCPGPDYRCTADQTTLQQANDFGVDDLTMINYFDKAIKSDTTTPFFAVLQTNALHSPFQQHCDSVPESCKFPSRYENALYIVDAYFQQLKTLLQKNHKLNNTLIIFTADHGDAEKLIHKAGRLVSFYDEVISIPFLIRTPNDWDKKYPDLMSNLRFNAEHPTTNIDIAPTIADFLGYSDKDHIVKKFAGKSLFNKIDTTRVFYALNTNETRSWQDEGFVIINRSNRFMCTTSEGIQFFDVSKDSNQFNNIYSTLDSGTINFYHQIINNNTELSRVFKRCNRKNFLKFF